MIYRTSFPLLSVFGTLPSGSVREFCHPACLARTVSQAFIVILELQVPLQPGKGADFVRRDTGEHRGIVQAILA